MPETAKLKFSARLTETRFPGRVGSNPEVPVRRAALRNKRIERGDR
jgi:hypothetical protein